MERVVGMVPGQTDWARELVWRSVQFQQVQMVGKEFVVVLYLMNEE